MNVTIKLPDEQEKMRVAGRLAAEVLDMIGEHVRPGVTTEALDQICHKYITETQDAVPAPLNYRGFPKSICTSVNHVVCHGIPGERKLKSGDAVNIDITVIKEGFHGDTSRMFFVGKPGIQAERLAQVAYDSMWLGIEQLAPGKRLGDIGAAIQKNVEKKEKSLFGGAGVLRAWDWPRISRGPTGLALRQGRHRHGVAVGHDANGRTDGQCRQAPCQVVARRLDRSDQGPQIIGAMGTHHTDHRQRL
jgi:methionyl aminopeptidase